MPFLKFARNLLVAVQVHNISSYVFSSQVSTLLPNNICLNTPFSPSTSPETRALEPYDYIVVGSGPGGGPLSARLAIAGFKVFLFEAGDDQGANLHN